MKNINQTIAFNHSIQPPLSNAANFKRFKGNYVVIGCIEKCDKNGDSYRILELSDISATIKMYCFDLNINPAHLMPNALIHVEATLKEKQGQLYVRGVFIQVIDKDSTASLVNINLLPQGYCAQPNLLKRFKNVVEQIHSRFITQFLAHVLADHVVSYRYLQCPASLRHHHHYSGGLLEHSIEVAEQLINQHSVNEKKFTQKERDIAIVAALLHDIGKTRTLTSDGKRTALGMMVDHDELTLEVCANALVTLDKTDTSSAMLLRHIWTCATPNARYGYQAITPIATALHRADHQSANNTFNLNNKIA